MKNYKLENIDKSWKVFFEIFGREKISNIIKNVEKDDFLPDKKNVFRIFREISLKDIKVVILGQDPYHQKGVADGLAFSTEMEKTPASLKNIFTELKNDLNVECSKNQLSSWVQQGVFLLNTCMTVKTNSPLSHKEEWESFSESLISYVNENRKDIIWVFWGKNAKKFKHICNIKSNFVIESAHPSPFSADRGFFGSKPFSKINIFLLKIKSSVINWKT